MNLNLSPKVAASTAGVGVTGSAVVVIIWLFGLVHVAVPSDVAVAIVTLLGSISALAAGYAVPHVPFLQQPQDLVRGLAPAPPVPATVVEVAAPAAAAVPPVPPAPSAVAVGVAVPG